MHTANRLTNAESIIIFIQNNSEKKKKKKKNLYTARSFKNGIQIQDPWDMLKLHSF